MNIDGIYKIILNKDNSIFTLYKNEFYVLMRIPSKQNMNIKLGEIKLQNKNYKLDRSDWYDLWTRKNDYFEYAMRVKRLKDYVSQFGTDVLFVVAPSKYVPGQTEFYSEDCILFHRMDFIARKRQFRQRLSDRLYCIVGIVIMYMQKIVRIMQEKLQLSRD